MKCCKFAAGILLLLICAILVIGCGASEKVPADIDAAKARILDCGWDLSYTQEEADLSYLINGFDFDCEGRLTAYLVAKDAGENTVLEVLFFELEQDAEAGFTMLASRISDPATYGRSGCQLWCGTSSAVEAYLS